MKKTMAILAILALLFACAAAAEEGNVVMRIVSCPEQGFSTLIRPEYNYDYHPDGGLTIWLGEPEESPSVSMFMVDEPGEIFDADYYFQNVYANLLKTTYGDDLLDAGSYETFTLSGREMPGRLSLYLRDGEVRMRFCAYDLRDDCFVRYEAFCPGDTDLMQKTLTAVAVAVGNFQPDPDYYGSSK